MKVREETNENPLEAEAILEYKPGADSRHDMIFGNVMGFHYGGYEHGLLWPPLTHQNQQQPQHQHQHQSPWKGITTR